MLVEEIRNTSVLAARKLEIVNLIRYEIGTTNTPRC